MTPEPSLRPEPVQTRTAAVAQDGALPLELLISNLLRYGVLLSIALVATGILLSFIHHPDYLHSADALERLTKPTNAPHALSDVIAELPGASGRALAMMGLLLLVSLPVTRVGLSLLVFTYQKDRPFVFITSAVLSLLLISFLLGQAAG